MNKKEIKITAPEGQVIDYNEEKGTINFVAEPLDIMKRINSFEDVCEDQNKNPKDYICTSSDPDDIMANATKMALVIARCFNEGKELDWSNENQRKYLMYLRYIPSSGWSLDDVVSWDTFTYCGARLHFANPDHVRRAWELFPEVYKNINNQFITTNEQN